MPHSACKQVIKFRLQLENYDILWEGKSVDGLLIVPDVTATSKA